MKTPKVKLLRGFVNQGEVEVILPLGKTKLRSSENHIEQATSHVVRLGYSVIGYIENKEDVNFFQLVCLEDE